MKCLGRGLKKKIISNEEVWGSRSIYVTYSQVHLTLANQMEF